MTILADSIMTTTDWFAVGGYLALMILVGLICRNISKDVSDYIRMGGKSTWWLAGLSVFMQSFSVMTFTGYAGQAYLAGWSIMIHYLLVALGFFVQAAIFAPWMRRTRAVTPPDATRLRFGPVVQQISVYLGLIGAFIWGGMFLLGLATFISPIIGFDPIPIIIVAGVIILFYSVAGGSWSVQITDNLQAFLLIPITCAVAVLALMSIGGIDGLFGEIQAQGLSADFAPLKGADHTYIEVGKSVGKNFFTLPWLFVQATIIVLNSANMGSCYRYLSIKTGHEARKAALLAGILFILGAVVWIIPAMVARLKFSADVETLASGLKCKADGAYAVAAIKLLPKGLLGLIIVAMCAAAMSSLDSFMTGTAGVLTRNLYVPLARALGKKPLEGAKLLLLTKGVNLFLGVWAIGVGIIFFLNGSNKGIFGTMMEIIGLFGAPMGTAFVLSFLAKRIPCWGPIAGGIVGMVCGLILKGLGAHYGWGMDWHVRTGIAMAVALIPAMSTRFFWFTATKADRDRVDHFFKLIRSPIDVEKEVGKPIDHSHLKTVGGLGLMLAAFVLVFVFSAETTAHRIAVLSIFAFIFVICGAMYLKGRKASSLADEVAANRAKGAEIVD